MTGNVTPYTDLITSEHQTAQKFMSMVSSVCQAWADEIAVVLNIPQLLDIDIAVGQQLDVLGEWIGISRNLSTPLTGVYFAFDFINVGFDQGVWKQPFDPSSGIVVLPDDFYRILLKVKIINNHWNGSVSEVYTLMNNTLAPLGYQFFIKDYADLSMDLGIFGVDPPPSSLVSAMLINGMLDIKPAGVRIAHYVYQSLSGPMFGFDINSTAFAGFDQGSWANVITN